MSADPVNPYAPPTADLTPNPVAGGISPRAAMLKHEVAIRSVALVFTIIGVILICGGLLALRHRVMPVPAFCGAMILGVLAFVVEFGLRRFRAWARVAGLLFVVASVLGFVLLLPFAFFVVPTLANRQSRTICSSEYRKLVASTPHLDIATSGVPRYFVMIFGAVVTVALWFGIPAS